MTESRRPFFIIRILRSLFSTGFEQFSLRLSLVMLAFGGLFVVMGGRLVQLAVKPDEAVTERRDASHSVGPRRPDVVDRNGVLLATDIDTASLYAEPKRILDVDEATELLTAVLPDLNARDLRDKLATKKGFVWVKRELSPKQQSDIHRLGIPGIGFIKETKRVYPNGNTLAHVVGAVDIDNKGIAGIERTIDQKGWLHADKPIQLSIDLRAQHVLREELHAAREKFKAKAASGAVIDVQTGEMIALVSLPDFDPNDAAAALHPDHINRLTVGVYEMGSTFKALTTAMALDSGKITLGSTFDARAPMNYGSFRIDDFHPQRRIMSVPEVFIHSSNIGTAKMALALGVDAHRSFLKKMGQLDRLQTELPESAAPIVPRRWVELNTVTISFGHGLSVAPLQATTATGALINGGLMIPPTILKRSVEEAQGLAHRVVKPETSNMMRYLMRLNAEKGTATKANVPGYLVGGKTGTAEKVINGRYAKNKVMTTFIAAFPMDEPRYMTLVSLDEPQGISETFGFATSGWNASPTTGKIIGRIAPILGVAPRHDPFQPPAPAADVTATLLPRSLPSSLTSAPPAPKVDVAQKNGDQKKDPKKDEKKTVVQKKPQSVKTQMAKPTLKPDPTPTASVPSQRPAPMRLYQDKPVTRGGEDQ